VGVFFLKSEEKNGIVYVTVAYLIWGILPIYWHSIKNIPSEQILAHRVVWAFVFMFLLLRFTGNMGLFFKQTKELWAKPKQFFLLVTAAFLVSGNWGIYIWAVNHGHLVETSLGYYINPLVSVLLGVVILKEKLSKPQIISFLLALIGVLIMTINFGKLPYVAFALAFSFAFYGLVKKMIVIDTAVSLALETFVVTPFVLIYLLFFSTNVGFGKNIFDTTMLLLSGAVTAIPLFYFGKGAIRIPLSTVGFLQYIAPTGMLLLGVLAYHEKFELIQFFAFSFIWASLAVFTASKTKWYERKFISKANLNS
jgi:chloramphenicol-sensitive protein RarD